MMKTKKLFQYFLLSAGLLATVTACNNDDGGDGPAISNPEVTVVETGLSGAPGDTVSITANLFAPAGLRSVTVTQGSTQVATKADFAAGDINEVYTFDYTLAADASGTVALTITVTDVENRTSTGTANITVGEAPAQNIVVSTSAEGVGDVTWTANNTYELSGFVFVNSGQTLTIEPGTVIKARSGTNVNASALIVARGGRIVANGTADAPIIFTSVADDLNSTSDIAINTRGLWGGLIVLGAAPVNTAAGGTATNPVADGEAAIEGIPPTETRGVYGGTNPDDNSGELSYISIRHGGSLIGQGNEINGLTLGGVGRGTIVSYIEVWGNDDDGIEWFGGTVNTDHLAALYCQDDSFDWDSGFTSENQFWVAVQQPGFVGSDRGMELDGVAGNNLLGATFFSNPNLYNFTLIGQGAAGNTAAAFFLEEGTGGKFYNGIITQFAGGFALGTRAGAGAFSAQRLGTDLVFKNHIFFNVADGTANGIAGGVAPITNYINDPANGIAIGDPGIPVSASFDAPFGVLPAAGGLAFTTPRAPLPAAAVNGFTYAPADYLGAFGAENWLAGWTAASAYGLLQ